MHKLFAEWYINTQIELTGDLLKTRWQGIENIIKDLNVQSALELIRLFLNKPSKNKEYLDTFRDYFRVLDATFRMRNNDFEITVLAGATIIHSLENHLAQATDTLALALLCSICVNSTTTISGQYQDAIESAKAYLLNEATRIRLTEEIPGLETYERIISSMENSITKGITILAEALKKVTPDAPLETTKIQQALVKPFEPVKDLLNKQNKALKTLEDNLEIQREESNMLWWVIGEFSRDFNIKISDLKLPQAPLLIAKELADITLILPGPRSAPALLDKMLSLVKNSSSKKVSLKDSVNGLTSEQRSSILTVKSIEFALDLCPIHFAIQKSLEVTGANEWLPIFEKQMNMKGDLDIVPLALSTQFYQERLLIRSTH